jgi:serine/threonine protein phosphatase PrpC
MLFSQREAIIPAADVKASASFNTKETLMTLCAKCGIENRETASFCLNCGHKLEHPDEPTHPAELSSDEESDVPITVPSLSEELPTAGPATEEGGEPPAAGQEAADEATPELVVADPTLVEDDSVITSDGEPMGIDLETEVPVLDQPAGVALELDEAEPGPVQAPEPDEWTLETEEVQSEGEPVVSVEEPEPSRGLILPPLEPGTLLSGRFEIVSLLEESPETLLYDAVDHGRCAQCGYADSLPDDLYCASCGALLESGAELPHVHLRALRVAGEAIIQLEEESEGRIERWLEADGQLFAVLPLPPAEPEAEPTPFTRGVRHIVGYNSDIGRLRELDEDALLILTLAPLFEGCSRPSLGLYAVADGMGGHEGGEVASRLAIEGLAEIIAKRLFLPELSGEPVLPETPAATLSEAFLLASGRIFNLQRTTGSDMGTTLTAALIRDDQALIANVGDSRTYLWRGGQLKQITTDHSLVAQLVAADMLKPDDIYNHPEKSAIYRSLGHTPEVEVDVFTQSLLPGDRLVLCCDGVWEMLRDEGIEEVLLLEAEPQRACDEIVRRSNLAGGEDNITVVIVQFEELEGQ